MEIDEDIIVISCLLEDEEERKTKRRMWVHEINLKRPIFGEYHALFVPDLLHDEERFFNYIHMSRAKFMNLYGLLKPHLTKQNTTFRMAVGPEERLVVCLRYFATGNSYRSLAENYRMGERTVREIVQSTSETIWNILQPIVMPKPDEELWMTSEKDFCERWNFPNAIAALDGKHVLIESPPHSGSNYFCYKKHFSLVLLALVDANKKFIAVDIGAYGKNSDAAIFRNSNMGKKIRQRNFRIPAPKIPQGGNQPLPHVVVGDEAFPLCTNLMRPYSRVDVRQNEDKKTFNYRLSRARNTVENTFGILVRKFRIFERRLNMSQNHTVSVVMAICCLHNFLRDDRCYWSRKKKRVQNILGLQDITHFGGNLNYEATEVRNAFKDYFCSEAGSVGWQQSRVRTGRQLQ